MQTIPSPPDDTTPAAPPTPAPILSPDGRQWWDGSLWREIASAAPPPPPPLAPPPWQAAPPPRSQVGLQLAAAVIVTALAGAGIVAGVIAATHRGTGTGSAAGTVASGPGTSIGAAAPGATHCTYRVSIGTFSLVMDAVDAPTGCATVQAAFDAAEQSVGGTVTPVDGVPTGATAQCSHQFGSSGYAVTIYSSGDGAIDQGFVQAACAAFLQETGGS
jgi:hypothetical protein